MIYLCYVFTANKMLLRLGVSLALDCGLSRWRFHDKVVKTWSMCCVVQTLPLPTSSVMSESSTALLAVASLFCYCLETHASFCSTVPPCRLHFPARCATSLVSLQTASIFLIRCDLRPRLVLQPQTAANGCLSVVTARTVIYHMQT
jgi:hypothetical protein